MLQPARQRQAVVALDRHPGGAEAHRGPRVVVLGREEVVHAAVEEGHVLALVFLRDRGAVHIVDPVQGLARDLVVDRVVVRREEAAVIAELVVVHQQHRRVLPHELHARVGLGLGACEHVAIEVEPVGVAAGVGLATVGVLTGDDQDDHPLQQCLDHAVVAVRQLVEDPQLGVGAALLGTVDVADHPADRGGAGGELGHLRGGRAGIADLEVGLADGLEAGRRHVRGLAHDGVVERAPLHRGPVAALDDPVAGLGGRLHVRDGLGARDLAVHPDADAQHRGRAGRGAHEHLLRGERIAPTGRRPGLGKRERGGGRRHGGALQEAPARHRKSVDPVPGHRAPSSDTCCYHAPSTRRKRPHGYDANYPGGS